jgi:xanthine dehydrogenase YagS FAD-binding subunit
VDNEAAAGVLGAETIAETSVSPKAKVARFSFEYFDVATIEEAVRLLRNYEGRAKVIAGGTDLLNVLKDRVLPASPEAVINLRTIPALDYIREDADGLKIGALARLKDIASSPLVKEHYPLLGEAARSVASPQIRNMATIGGNLCQEVRCWYYRTPHLIRGRLLCARKGGTKCFALGGDNRYSSIFGGSPEGCYAVCLSDMAIALVALGAKAKTSKRIIPLDDFFTPGAGTVLEKDEVLTELQVPRRKAGTKAAYLKFRIRKAMDFAIVSVGSVIMFEGDTCKDARITLGGVAPIPWRARSAEDALWGKAVDAAVAGTAAKAAVAGAVPLSMNAYKVPLTEALVKRAILASR